MSDAIKTKQTLEISNEELTLLVKERTDKLADANEQLLREINERERVEEAREKLLAQIERGKREWEATVDAMSDLVCLLDYQGCVIRTNHTIETWGISSIKEALGRPLPQLLHPTESDSYIKSSWQQAQKALSQGQNMQWETEDAILNRYLHFQMYPVAIQMNGPSQKSSFAVVVIRDITERKQAERALAQRNQTLKTLNQLSQDIASTLDLRLILDTAVKSAAQLLDITSAYIYDWDNERGIVTLIAEYHGPDASDLERISHLGTTYDLEVDFGILSEEWQHDPRDKYVIHTDDLNLSAKEQARMEKHLGKSVLRIPLLVKGKFINLLELWDSRYKRAFTAEEVEPILAIARQTVLAIDNAHLYKQAMESSRLKSELLAKVSHELRTPLGAILGLSQLLEVGTYGPILDKRRDTIGRIISRTEELSALVEELLDQAQLETGKPQLKIAPFVPATFLDQVESSTSVLAKNKGIALITNIALDMPAKVFGDLDRLRQILINLVGNAIKFTDQGTVSVHICLHDAAHWAMQVSDTGLGIPVEAHGRIFDAFHQVGYSITRTQEGVGLGLSITKQLVTLMGGQILLESEVGNGSTFTVILPLESG
ncbi:MAG: PAS domain S-box protein [Chloroflexi bacterium]|nr:PAS domain S-box protein [Chloroflexota bacterium]